MIKNRIIFSILLLSAFTKLSADSIPGNPENSSKMAVGTNNSFRNMNFKELTVKNFTIVDDEPNFAIDGAFHELEYGLLIKPFYKKDKELDSLMAPLRDTFEKLPGDYSYNEKTKEVILGINGKLIKMKVGSKEANIDGKRVEAPYAPELHLNKEDNYSSLYLPVKFIFENLDTDVKWDRNRNRFSATVILGPREGTRPFPTGGKWIYKSLLDRKSEEFKSETAIKIANQMLDYQNSDGGWMKLPNDADMSVPVRGNTEILSSTIDNDATFTQIRFLAKVHTHTKDKRYAISAIKGIEYLIKGQYKNGGWAQYFPEATGYFKHITINDDAMVNVLRMLQDVIGGNEEFNFVKEMNPKVLKDATVAYDKGIKSLLSLQIVENGKKTAWAAQYDKGSLKPVQGRAFELASISGQESVKVLRFLMSLENPSKEIQDAIISGINWFESVKISGKRVVTVRDNSRELGFERFLRDDEKSTIWARFYELETNKPIFSSRDGVTRYDMAEISYERRNKYSWYTTAPMNLLTKDYPEWKEKNNIKK